MALLYLGRSWTKSSYLAETALGVTNNNANVYVWSFSASAHETAESGIDMNTYKFTGNEQLQIIFATTLAAGVTIDVYAHMNSIVEVSSHSNTKVKHCLNKK